MDEVLNDDTWDIFHWLLYYAHDRSIHQYGKRRKQSWRNNCASVLVCLFFSDRSAVIPAFWKRKAIKHDLWKRKINMKIVPTLNSSYALQLLPSGVCC